MLEAVTLKRKNVIMRFLQVCSCERGKQEGTGGGKVCDEVCVRVCWGGEGEEALILCLHMPCQDMCLELLERIQEHPGQIPTKLTLSLK